MNEGFSYLVTMVVERTQEDPIWVTCWLHGERGSPDRRRPGALPSRDGMRLEEGEEVIVQWGEPAVLSNGPYRRAST